MGSVSGDPESTFRCSSGFSMSLVGGLWFALTIALFAAFYLRIVQKAWKLTVGRNPKYTMDEFTKIAVTPLAMFVLLFVLLQTIK
jgi:hypothetical protein